MKLYIPRLGDELVLAKDWTFTLFYEHRNESLWDFAGHPIPVEERTPFPSDRPRVQHTFPADTRLKIERIFIRKGAEDFDSVTFLAPGLKSPAKTIERKWKRVGYPYAPDAEGTWTEKKPAKTVRFWVKLDDANNIEFKTP